MKPLKSNPILLRTNERRAEDGHSQKAQEDAATSEAINKLTLTRRYYVEALKFIGVLHGATTNNLPITRVKNKSEVIEAMDYFEIGDAYNIEQNKSWNPENAATYLDERQQ